MWRELYSKMGHPTFKLSKSLTYLQAYTFRHRGRECEQLLRVYCLIKLEAIVTVAEMKAVFVDDTAAL
jgi:hypothetical protein